MSDVQREKFARLMAQAEEMEEQIAAMQRKAGELGSEDELHKIERKLAEVRTELARISDGCGKPRIGG